MQSSIIAILLLTTMIAFGDQTRPYKFFAFRNGMPGLTFDEEAAMLKRLGYDGISQVKSGGNELQKRVDAYRKRKLKVLSIYLDAGKLPFAPETYSALGESGGIIELTVREIEDGTVDSIRQLAATAAPLNVLVALYPHHGFAIATMPDAMELATKVDQPNLGIMFNLCHFLKNERADDLESILEKSAPRLFSVSTCGADIDGTNWATLIQPLDQGSFPQRRLLDALEKIGYQGPVCLQCYNIKGDKTRNLERSVDAWRKIGGKRTPARRSP